MAMGSPSLSTTPLIVKFTMFLSHFALIFILIFLRSTIYFVLKQIIEFFSDFYQLLVLIFGIYIPRKKVGLGLGLLYKIFLSRLNTFPLRRAPHLPTYYVRPTLTHYKFDMSNSITLKLNHWGVHIRQTTTYRGQILQECSKSSRVLAPGLVQQFFVLLLILKFLYS